MMDKATYFLNAVVSDAIYSKHWGMSLFAVTRGGADEEHPYDWQLRRTEDNVQFYNPILGDWDIIKGMEPDELFCYPRDPLTLPPGVLVNAPEGVKETTYGCVFVNHLIFCLPFGDRIPFQNGYISASLGYKLAQEHMVDDPEEGETIPKGAITVSQYQMYGEHVEHSVAFNDAIVHSVTPKSMLIHPAAKKLKAELIEKFTKSGQINDPVIIAKIGDALEKLDREFLKDDPIMDYYTSGKYFGKIRKKLFYMFGAESSFTDGNNVHFIPNSLREGIDLNYLPEVINASRYGSYSRGALTQLGGAKAKDATRATGNIEITKDDCGAKLGLTTTIYDDADKYSYIGRFMLVNGKPVELNPELIEKHLGKEIVLRSPQYCKANETGVSYCAKCLGSKLAAASDEIPSLLVGVTGKFTLLFLAAFHGTELKTAEYQIDRCIF